MNNRHHHRDPPPPNIGHTTTAQILKQTLALLQATPLTFLFLSTLLLSFRSNVHTVSHYLSSLVDHDPSLKTLLARLDFSPSRHPTRLQTRRRRAFLHLSRVETLDDEFLSGESDFDSSLFHSNPRKPQQNSTFFTMSHLFSHSGFSSYGRVVKPGVVSFRTVIEEEVEGFVESNGSISMSNNGNGVMNLDFLIKGFELGRPEAMSLFFLAGVLSVAYAYIVLIYTITYAWVSGIVFLRVVDGLVGNGRSFFRTVWEGLSVGIKRLSGFMLMRWAVRDALAQLVGIFFFGKIMDQYVFFKVFLRMKSMPFANVAPWVIGREWQSSGFIVVWFLSDLVLSLVFAVDTWVAIVKWRRGGREIVREGCHMLVVLFTPAFEIRWLEAIICGSVGRWMLRRIFGDAFTLIFQSLMEVYFMVAWLVFYLAAKHKDDSSLGITFGRRELKRYLVIAR